MKMFKKIEQNYMDREVLFNDVIDPIILNLGGIGDDDEMEGTAELEDSDKHL